MSPKSELVVRLCLFSASALILIQQLAINPFADWYYREPEEIGATDMTWVVVSTNRILVYNIDNPDGVILSIHLGGTNFFKLGHPFGWKLVHCGKTELRFK